VITVYLLVSCNEMFDFLTSYSSFLNFVNGGSMTNAKVYQGFRDDKKVKSTDLDNTFFHTSENTSAYFNQKISYLYALR